MKLENKSQKILPVKNFVARLFKYFNFVLILISISLGIGITGYSYFGELNFIDSFHMSSMILTGMGPVAEMKTQSAKMFSSFYALYSGVAFLSITAVFFAPIIHRLMHILHVEDEDSL